MIELRKYKYVLSKAKIKEEDVDKHFKKVDRIMPEINVGDIIYKYYYKIGGKHDFCLIPCEISSIIDKESGNIEINTSYSRENICVTDIHIEKTNFKICDFSIEYLKKHTCFFEMNNLPVSFYFSDIVDYYYIEDNNLSNFRIKVFCNYKENTLEISIDENDIDKDVAILELKKFIMNNGNFDIRFRNAIVKRAQSINDIIISCIIDSTKNYDKYLQPVFFTCKDITVPTECTNKSRILAAILLPMFGEYCDGDYYRGMVDLDLLNATIIEKKFIFERFINCLLIRGFKEKSSTIQVLRKFKESI